MSELTFSIWKPFIESDQRGEMVTTYFKDIW